MIERAMDATTFDKAKPSSRYRDEGRAATARRVVDAAMSPALAHRDGAVLGVARHRLTELATGPTPAHERGHVLCETARARRHVRALAHVHWDLHRDAPRDVYWAGSGDPERPAKANLENVKLNKDQNVAYLVSQPISAVGTVAGLRSLPMPDDAVGKVAGMSKLQFSKAARRVGGEAIDGLAWAARLAAKSHPSETCGPVANRGVLELKLTEAQRAKWRPGLVTRAEAYQSGVQRNYREEGEPARAGAVTDAGGRADVVCYADL